MRSIITAFKKTPDLQSGDELNAEMSSSFRGSPAFQSREDVIRLGRKLKSFKLPRHLKTLLGTLKKEGFLLSVIPKNGNFSEYVDYVLKNRRDLTPEVKYTENHLLKGNSWGEILIIKNKGKIVASFGPNRIEKDKEKKVRARPGYFSVLPEFRKKKIGTVLWWLGLERMRKMGASYIECSVEKENLPALKIYLGSGMNEQN